MRVFQEEIFGPTPGITTFKMRPRRWPLPMPRNTAWAGVWTRDTNRAFRMGRGIKAGRVWLNCYHAYFRLTRLRRPRDPASGARAKMALEHYQQTKNMLVSHDINPLGFSDYLSMAKNR